MSATAREALVAELLGEIDGLTRRLEALPERFQEVEIRAAASAAALDDAAGRYRDALDAFDAQAKAALAEFLKRKAAAAADSTLEAQRALMAETARAALAPVLQAEVPALICALQTACQSLHHSTWARRAECAIVGGISAVVASAIVLLVWR